LQLWEESQVENERLRDRLRSTHEELAKCKDQLDNAFQVVSPALDGYERTARDALNKSCSLVAFPMWNNEKLQNLCFYFLSPFLWAQSNARNAMTEAEKRERRALERKLSEMEEELKVSKLLISYFSHPPPPLIFEMDNKKDFVGFGFVLGEGGVFTSSPFFRLQTKRAKLTPLLNVAHVGKNFWFLF